MSLIILFVRKPQCTLRVWKVWGFRQPILRALPTGICPKRMCQLGDRLIVLADISLSFPAWSMPRIFNSGPLFAPRMQKAAASIHWTLQDYLTYQSYTVLINLNCQESIVYLLQSPASFLSASLGLGIQLAYTIWEILDSTCWGGRMQYLIDWE